MENENIKQEINNYIEIRKNLWTAIIVLNGGLAGLFLTFGNLKPDMSNYLKIFIFILGSILNYFFFNTVGSINGKIKKLINQLRKGYK